MAAKKSTATPSVAPAPQKTVGIECADDHMRAIGGHIDHTPLAINPDAGALDLALGTQARVRRLARIMVDVSTGDTCDSDSLDMLTGYAEEIVALADATVDRLQRAEAHHG